MNALLETESDTCDGTGTITCHECDGEGVIPIETCQAVWFDETLTEQRCDRQDWSHVNGAGRLCPEHKRQGDWARQNGKRWSNGRLVAA